MTQVRIKRRRRKRRRPTESQMITSEAKKLREMVQTSDSARVRRLKRLGLTASARLVSLDSNPSDGVRSPRKILGVRFG